MRLSRSNPQQYEYLLSCKSDMIYKHLLDCHNQIYDGCRPQDITFMIKGHKRLVNQLQLDGKNKYKTLGYLEQFRNTKNHKLALSILTNTLNNRGIFSKFLSN